MVEEKNELIVLDGTIIRLVQPDLDGDGIRGGIETIVRNPDVDRSVNFMNQKNELSEAMESLNDDRVDPKTNMSMVDFHSNINESQANALPVLEFLISIGFLPKVNLQLPRQVKRDSTSIHGLGRQQKTDMVIGKREHDRDAQGTGLMGRLSGLFKKKEEE